MILYSSIVLWSSFSRCNNWVFTLRLDLVDLLAWVGAHIWRFCWVEEGVALLNGITNVYVAILSTLGDGNSTWPSHRFDNIDCIRF